ncbi:MAG: hypothetical protein ACRENK_06735 [Gemmatimonadaceae bacterium]
MLSMRPALLSVSLGLLAAACGSDSSSPPVAGPPASISKAEGDNQTADPGAILPIKPSVKVVDSVGVPVAGAVVTFSIGDGSGTLNGGAPVTNSAGVATIGGWTLGPIPGAPNTLLASVGSLAPTTFTATATGVNPCDFANAAAYTLGTTANGTLSTSDCPSQDASYVDLYKMTVPTSGAYSFSQSATWDTYLLLAVSTGQIVAENDDVDQTTTNSVIKVLLPAGNYFLVANSFLSRVTGDYGLSSAQVSESMENCEDTFIVRPMTTSQTLSTTDCLNNGFYSDDNFIWLSAGDAVTVTVSSTVFDAYIEIYSRNGLVASNDDRDTTTTDAQVTYTATTGAYYLIAPTTKLSGTPGTTGAYTLVIQ